MQKVNQTLKGIRVDELSFRLNGIRPQAGGKFDLKPAFSRRVRRAVENEKVMFVSLSVKIESTKEMPKPFDLAVVMTGVFETEAGTDAEKKAAVADATAVLYPYLRATVTGLTGTAMTSPLVLPVVNGVLFPEDRDTDGEVFS